jgi:hypothetical protein
MEMLGGGVLGSLLGGVFRLVPEFLKAFDRKNERQHELSMFDRQCRMEEQRGQQKLAEIGAARDAAIDTGVIDSFKLAIEQQTEMVKAAGGWVASLSASVRPVMTYYLLLIYGLVKTAVIAQQVAAGNNFVDVLPKVWGVDDMALLSGVVNYYFIDRSLMKRGL